VAVGCCSTSCHRWRPGRVVLTAVLTECVCRDRRSFVSSVTEQLTGTLSLGAAVFASVLFASGMPSEVDVVSEREEVPACTLSPSAHCPPC
jgi:hypothetical protein